MFEDNKTDLSVIKVDSLSDELMLEDYEAINELGNCFTSIGQYQQAQEFYDRAAVLEPDRADPYVGIGMIALQQGDLDEAMNAFRVARRLDPQCAKAYCGLAMAHQEIEEFSEAFDLYLKCLELDTNDLTALLGLFQTSCLMGSFSKVIHYLEVYLDMHADDSSVMFCLATLYMKDKRLFQAQKILTDILKIDPENTDSINLLEEVEHLLAQRNAARSSGYE